MTYETSKEIDWILKDGGFILTESEYNVICKFRSKRGNLESFLNYLTESTSMAGDKKTILLLSYITGHFRYQSGNLYLDNVITHKVNLGYTSDLGMELQ